MGYEHKYTVLEDFYTKTDVEIDTKIVPLIKALWARGDVTTMSCQEDDDGNCWIEFEFSMQFNDVISYILLGTKIKLTIRRKGNTNHFRYDLRFDKKYIPRLTKLFTEGR